MTVDDGLSKAMDAVNIDPTHKSKLVPYLKTQGKISVEQKDGVYNARVDTDMGPVPIVRFDPDWASSDDGKPYIAKSTGPNPKGGAGGGDAATIKRSEWDTMSHHDRSEASKAGKKVVDD